MISVLSVDRQGIFPSTALMPSVMAVMNLVTLPRTARTKFLHQEHCATMADLITGIITTTTRGTDHTPIMVTDIGDVIADHSPSHVHTMTEVAVLEETLHALLPATAAALVTPHPALTISPTGTTHTTPWTGAGLILGTSATQQ